MSTDNTPPRVWWDGSDFLYLISDDALASRQERVPGFYRARTVKDLPDDAVELRPAPAPAVPDTAEPPIETFCVVSNAVMRCLGNRTEVHPTRSREFANYVADVVLAELRQLPTPTRSLSTEETRTDADR